MRPFKCLSRRSASALGMAVFSSLGVSVVSAATQNSIWTDGGGDSNWSTAGNWSPVGVPNNGNGGISDYNVTVGAPSPTNVNSGFTIDSLIVGTAGLINISAGDALSLIGPTLADNGAIFINPTGIAAVTQLILSNTIISGGGAITLNGGGNGNAARLDGTGIQSAGHTVNGNGNINATLINNGTINGNIPIGSLNITGIVTNNNLIEATNNGSLAISGLVSGGTLSTSGGGLILGVANGTIANVTTNGTINIPQGNALNAAGTITDNGSIVINPTGVAAVTQLIFAGGTVAGSGQITLNGNGNGNASRLDGTLTQLAPHTINGNGNINADMTNSGTINGNSTLGSLNINGTITNTGLIESTSSGTLAIFGTVVGGTLNTSGGGIIQGDTGTISNVTNNGTVNVPGGNLFNVINTLTNNGLFVINPTGVAQVTGLEFSGGAVGGSGTITLNGGGNPNAARLDGALTQSAGHTIDGNGNLNATVINAGTLNGDSTLGPLFLNGNITNTGLLESTGGGVLAINAATVTGGTFNTSSGGAVQGINNGTAINVTNHGEFDIPGGSNFNISGSLINSGTITINSNQAVAGTSLTFQGATVTGTGTIKLNDNIGTAAELDGTLTQGVGHSITGFGQIFATLVNNGVIDGNVSGETLNLVNNNTTNNNLLESTNGGALALQGASVSSGMFNNVQVSGGTTSTISGVTNIGPLSILGGNVLNVSGSITDNGTISVNSNQAAAQTALTFNGGTISGSGSIILSDSINTAAQLAGTLTQAITHTISGFGQINALLTNYGIVNANMPGLNIDLNNTLANNALVEATNGGNLNLNGITIVQGVAAVATPFVTASGSSSFVNLNGATITGGMVSTSTGGTVQLAGSPNFIPGTITNNGTVLVSGGNVMLVGRITGTGTITVTNNGHLRLAGIAAASTAATVSVNSGVLDLTTNKLVINYGSPANDPVAAIAADLAAGRNGGPWNGGGITSSSAALNPSKFAVGYVDGNNPADTTAHTVVANQMKIAYTLAGDAFLENTVGFDDLVVVAQDFGFTGEDWAGGDFNYDPSGSVGFPDLVSVAQNFGFSSGVSEGSVGGAQAPAWQTAASVPEPVSLSFVVAVAGVFLGRRRVRR